MATYHGVTVVIEWQRLAAEGTIKKEYLGTLDGSAANQTFYTANFPITTDAGVTTDDETEVNVYTDDGTPGTWTEYADDGTDFVITGATGAVVIQAAENQGGNAGERVSIDYYYSAEVGQGQGATIETSRDLVTSYKLGNENPQEIKAGKIAIKGHIDDLYVSRDLFGKIMGVSDFYGKLADFSFYLYPNKKVAGQPRIKVSNVQGSLVNLDVTIDTLIANGMDFEGLAVAIDVVPA